MLPADSSGAKRRSSAAPVRSGAPLTAARLALHALGALLLAVGTLPNGGAGLRIFAVEFREHGAGAVTGAEPVQGNAELEERFGRPGRVRVIGGDVQELLGGLAVAVPLEIALAEPIGRLRHELVARMGLEEAAKAHFRLLELSLLQERVGALVIGARVRRAGGGNARGGSSRGRRRRLNRRPACPGKVERRGGALAAFVLLDEIADPRHGATRQGHGRAGRRRGGRHRSRGGGRAERARSTRSAGRLI